MYSDKISESELISNVADDYFKSSKNGKELNCNKMLGNIDFCVSFALQSLYHNINFLWAEAKRGRDKDIIESLIQLILTIGKEKTFSNELPPAFLGALDCEKIAFIEWHEIQHIFSQNDFNWNVTPSNHESKEFKQLYSELKSLLDSKKMLFYYDKDSKQLKEFIESNFVITNKNIRKIQIDKNNFNIIYQQWYERVKPTINIDWEVAKKHNILDADFYLADILSKDNHTIIDKLFVVLRKNKYELLREINEIGLFTSQSATFRDNRKKHIEFWNVYERPPLKQYWDYIIDRRDLLVPQDFRERKGAFFTPQIWVYKAQEFLAKTLGENFQDEYYIWDLAAGTGNLLDNLINDDNIFASTIDKSDVNIMQELAMKKSLNLHQNHIFQFDFLNDCLLDKPCSAHLCKLDSKCDECLELNRACIKHTNFVEFKCKECKKSKVPHRLQEILKDSKKREKLIIFINPPYAEAGTTRQLTSTGKNKQGVSVESRIYDIYKECMGKASNELFAQFFFRIYKEISGCILASFSTLKYVNSSNFIKFRENFKAKFLSGFICPSYTFDNVRGDFPIGFLIWNLGIKDSIKNVSLDVFYPNVKIKLEEAKLKGKKVEILKGDTKIVKSLLDSKNGIAEWIKEYKIKKIKQHLGMMNTGRVDFQNQRLVYIKYKIADKGHSVVLNACNLVPCSVFFAVRLCIKATWLNDRDQFFEPNEKWSQDVRFHNDCLAFMLFHPKNRISTKDGENHFIPFKAREIGAREAFKSDFMYKFINGKIKADSIESNFNETSAISGKTGAKKDSNIIKIDSIFDRFIPSSPLHFSPEALAVFNAGKEIFKYYHAQDFSNLAFHYNDGYDRIYNPNASLYDIKAHFQGFSLDSKGNATKMNPLQKCQDFHYANLANALNLALDELAKNIESKVYEYEFLL